MSLTEVPLEFQDVGIARLLPKAEENWASKALRDKSPSKNQMFCSRQFVFAWPQHCLLDHPCLLFARIAVSV